MDKRGRVLWIFSLSAHRWFYPVAIKYDMIVLWFELITCELLPTAVYDGYNPLLPKFG